MNPFEFDHVEWLMEREAEELGLNRETRLGMIAYRTAEDVFDKVKDYCEDKNNKEYNGEWVRCVADHNPDKFDKFVNKYLNGEELEQLKRVIEENPDVYKSLDEFWNEVKILYNVFWDEWMASTLAEMLSYHLEFPISEIWKNPDLSASCKIKRLKGYATILENFRKAISRALKEEKPLSKNELYHWFTDLDEIGIKTDQQYNNILSYWLDFYDMLPDDGKLETLERLHHEIIDTLFPEISKISRHIEKESNLLTNQT
ncbi:hypothetical protein AVU39_gp21 [Sulfolobus monocaudavirus SMV2]|uniref:hypothetical protein n=1 Tax=Sulfolobus monocaudavirus SMV2 TaxID=1580591 RepID=UPI0006D30D4B|nr:hypothetical protein AVU39_gp21 [Sulfolobus monocaudavirus SMV2]AIZ11355.1 hypothetical protein [Sulfolobus monocaudavirus SMV2]